ncbi:hypothetical protein [Peribacillus alkalitolerans]|uniref:hypothetical protein n=1 Tax=Peribacillus alkalitolerans TaxID=1550385 RepID=UPI0013D75CA2|nr:hypothetical protein [Peribacillus alkalitolerans]
MVEYTETNRGLTHRIQTEKTLFQFMFPFSLRNNGKGNFMEAMLEQGFHFFNLKDTNQEGKYYGEHSISHRSLEKYFLPNIEPILFPKSYKSREGFRRFSKEMDLDCNLSSEHLNTSFHIPSFDILICPFHIGIMNIRVELPSGLSVTDALQFGDIFRVMEPIMKDEENMKIGCGEKIFSKMKDFIFETLCPLMVDYMEQHKENSPYFGSLPFFIDERMYVLGYLAVVPETEITKVDLFRIGQLNGYDREGNPVAGALNEKYINRYYDRNVYDRWADETYYVTSDYTFCCITKSDSEEMKNQLASQMYGQHFYALLLYFYYKIVLMKLTYEHSKIDIEKDQSSLEKIILMITEFSAKYFFPEVNSRTSGKEIFQIVKDVYQIEHLYEHVKKTLETLYQNQEKLAAKRNNYLLQILTTYTVISGIYGMNLVIKDWEGKIKWGKIPGYTLFEWISLIVALSGITVGTILGLSALTKWIKERKSNKNELY